MNKRFFWILLLTQVMAAQQIFDRTQVEEFQSYLNKQYADSVASPLKKSDRKDFESLAFYEIDARYAVKARFVRTKKEKPFPMPTTTSRKPMYVKYGELHFTLEGVTCSLNVYQNTEFSKKPEYKDLLFLPYTDLTSGVGSYGGGRYIDLKFQKGKYWLLDFNKSYNPYCAYNEKYSCPIPPQENDLKVEIKAGVKAFKTQ